MSDEAHEQFEMTRFSRLFSEPPDEEARWKARVASARAEVRTRLSEIASYQDHKQLAAKLGMREGHFSDALNGKERKKFDLIEHLPIFLIEAPNDDLVDTLASVREEPASHEEIAIAAVEAADEYLSPAQKPAFFRTYKRKLNKNRRRLRRVG